MLERRQESSRRPRRDRAAHHLPKRERLSSRVIAKGASPLGHAGDSVRSSQPNMTHSTLAPACSSWPAIGARAKNLHRRTRQHDAERSLGRDDQGDPLDASDTEHPRPKEPFAARSQEWYPDDDCRFRLGSPLPCEAGSCRSEARSNRFSWSAFGPHSGTCPPI